MVRGAMVPWYYGARCLGSMVRDAVVRRCHGAMVCGTLVPWCVPCSELAVRRTEKAPEGTVPSPSPGRPVVTHSRRRSSFSSPLTADGFRTGTLVPIPQS
ncbi:hypothetical protein T459_04138 [Capsicum annuum]|uniref:Uncharacterized protein n=1 Tax=Capsicum annuum TaxID=4072 RepID=A0A2G3A455_CAPAN|nr:hypothetical protein T459_04138 [Capsicum annuum]